MKRFIFLALVLLICVSSFGIPISATRDVRDRIGSYTGPVGGTAIDDNIKASLDALHAKVDKAGTGSVFYVDSNVASAGAGTSWAAAVATLDEAVALCTDNNGDVVYIAAGHNENWTGTDSADLDVIGVTYIGYGEGTDRPRFDYDDADAELVIAAANVKIYNLTFQPGYNQVVHAIEVEADADGSIIDNCEFFDGEAETTDEFIDAIQPATASDDLIVSNCIATETSAGANTWLDMSTGIIDRVKVVNNYVRGPYAEGCIYSNKVLTNSYIAGNVCTNTATGVAAIVFSTTASGTMINNYAASDTPGTIIDPGSMEQAMNMEVDYGAAEDADGGPAWALANTRPSGNYPANIENDSLLAMIMAMDNGGVATIGDYDNDTMSLEALNIDLDALITAIALVPQSGGSTSWNATALGAIEAEATDAIEADYLHFLYSAADGGSNPYPDSVAAQSALAFIMCTGANPAVTTYDNTTMSLQALNVDLDALITSMALVPQSGGTTSWNATALAAIEAEATDAIEADELNLLINEADSDDAADNSIIAKMCSKNATADFTSYNNQTDSLEAIRDALDAKTGMGFRGTCTVNATDTQAISADLAGFGDDYFNTGWSLIVLLDYSGAGSAPEGEIVDITDYVSSTGTFTLNVATSAALTTGDEIYIRRTEDLELDIPTLLGSAGTIRYVDSTTGATGDGSGLTWENAYATIALAEAACSEGDVVYIADGHDEAVGDLVLNVANTSFIGLGEGDARPKLDYDADTDEITINAAGITVKNIRLRPGDDKITKAIHVEASGIGCTLENISCIVAEGGNEEFEDCILVDAAAAKLTIKNCTAYNSSATAADCDTFINIEDTPLDNCTIIGCYAYGDFSDAPIFWGAGIPTNLRIQDNIVTNTTTGQCGIEGTGNATGWLVNNLVCTDAIGTSYDPGRLADAGNYWDDFDTYDTSAVLWATNETGVNRWGATELAQLEGEAEDAIEADSLDKLVSADDSTGATAYPDSVAQDSIFAYIMGDDTSPVVTTYNNTTDSLEAIGIKTHLLELSSFTAGSIVAGSVADFLVAGAGSSSLGTNCGTDKSIIDAIGSDGVALLDVATGLAGIIGIPDDASNACNSSTITADDDGSLFERAEDMLQHDARCASYTKTDLSGASGDTTIFTVANGPVRVLSLIGIVTNTLGNGPSNAKFCATPTSPGVQVDVTSAVAVETDAAGTVFYTATTFGGALVPVTNGAAADPELEWICPAGVIQFNLSANLDADDSITFYIRYEPMYPTAVVTGG